ncbi:hypothetical protein E4U52_002723 [Claviceps spartinae]|nr:hypothetical protein E4U52_002723 [Claviceps spartinae]
MAASMQALLSLEFCSVFTVKNVNSWEIILTAVDNTDFRDLVPGGLQSAQREAPKGQFPVVSTEHTQGPDLVASNFFRTETNELLLIDIGKVWLFACTDDAPHMELPVELRPKMRDVALTVA